LMLTRRQEKWLAAAALLAAVLFPAAGSARPHKVFDPGATDFGLVTFHRISDRQMVIETTFSGVARRGARLHLTYDRAETRGKKACPT